MTRKELQAKIEAEHVAIRKKISASQKKRWQNKRAAQQAEKLLRPDLTFVLNAASCADSVLNAAGPLGWMTNSILVFNQMGAKLRLDITFLYGQLVISAKDVTEERHELQTESATGS